MSEPLQLCTWVAYTGKSSVSEKKRHELTRGMTYRQSLQKEQQITEIKKKLLLKACIVIGLCSFYCISILKWQAPVLTLTETSIVILLYLHVQRSIFNNLCCVGKCTMWQLFYEIFCLIFFTGLNYVVYDKSYFMMLVFMEQLILLHGVHFCIQHDWSCCKELPQQIVFYFILMIYQYSVSVFYSVSIWTSRRTLFFSGCIYFTRKLQPTV